MITEDYVSFEIAKLLREKGFTEKCRTYYKVFPKDRIAAIYHSSENRGVSEDDPNEILCPTLQMAMKWLREVHKLHIELNWNYANQQYSFQIWKIGKSQPEIYSLDLWHDNHKYADEWNYEQACEVAIKYCLLNLI